MITYLLKQIAIGGTGKKIINKGDKKMQEFEFVDNEIFEKNGKEYLNKGQVVVDDITYYYYIITNVPCFAGLYLPKK